MKIRFLNKKEKNELISYFNKIGIKVDEKLKKEDIKFEEDNKYYLLNDQIIAFQKDGIIIPHLKFLINFDENMKYIKVDEGAIKYVLNGADIFRPGIKEFSDNIDKNDLVLILSPDNSILGIGLSLLSSEEIKSINKGKVVKNLHYINDKLFNIKISQN